MIFGRWACWGCSSPAGNSSRSVTQNKCQNERKTAPTGSVRMLSGLTVHHPCLAHTRVYTHWHGCSSNQTYWEKRASGAVCGWMRFAFCGNSPRAADKNAKQRVVYQLKSLFCSGSEGEVVLFLPVLNTVSLRLTGLHTYLTFATIGRSFVSSWALRGAPECVVALRGRKSYTRLISARSDILYKCRCGSASTATRMFFCRFQRSLEPDSEQKLF